MRLRRRDPVVTEADLFDETPEEVIERRLAACEAHLADLEERMTSYQARLAAVEQKRTTTRKPVARNA